MSKVAKGLKWLLGGIGALTLTAAILNPVFAATAAQTAKITGGTLMTLFKGAAAGVQASGAGAAATYAAADPGLIATAFAQSTAPAAAAAQQTTTLAAANIPAAGVTTIISGGGNTALSGLVGYVP